MGFLQGMSDTVSAPDNRGGALPGNQLTPTTLPY
jgi:hypothetical protein